MFGNGYPVVFLHGFLESMTMWEDLKFEGIWQQVFIDLPGHGGSESMQGSVSMQSMKYSMT